MLSGLARPRKKINNVFVFWPLFVPGGAISQVSFLFPLLGFAWKSFSFLQRKRKQRKRKRGKRGSLRERGGRESES